MNTIRNITFALSLVAGAGIACAEGSYTREQVKADLTEAQRTGNVVANGETGVKLNELNPRLYPAKPAVQGKTRAQVKGELAEARSTGDIVGNSRTGEKLNEMYPDRYPPKRVVVGKTRAEVKAELAAR